jgi:hypothetical protein
MGSEGRLAIPVPRDGQVSLDVVPKQLVFPLAVNRAPELEAIALIGLLRRAGFDLRRRMFVSFAVDFADRRDAVYDVVRSLTDTTWDASMYGDRSGWVVRMSRSRRLTSEAAQDAITDVKQLAARFRGHVRGLTVEDLHREDCWGEMASQLRDRGRRRADASRPPQPSSAAGSSLVRRGR